MHAIPTGLRTPLAPYSQRPGAVSRLKGLLRLALAVAMITAFMFWIGPALQQRFEPLGQLARHIEASGIAANMIYYTEVPATGESETAMRDSMQYPPVESAP